MRERSPNNDLIEEVNYGNTPNKELNSPKETKIKVKDE